MKQQSAITSAIIILLVVVSIGVYVSQSLTIYDNQLYINPYNDGSITNLQTKGSTDHFQCVNEGMSNDGDKSYVFLNEPDLPSVDQYGCPPIGVYDGQIGSIQVVACARYYGTGTAELHLGLDTENWVFSPCDDSSVLTSGYKEYTVTFDERPSGGQFLWSDLEDMGIGVKPYIYPDASGEVRITSVYVVINYGTVNPIYNLEVSYNTTRGYVEIENLSMPLQVTSRDYESGSIVKLIAHSVSPYEFIRWAGDLESESNPDVITMDGHKSITAVFSLPDDPDPGPDPNDTPGFEVITLFTGIVISIMLIMRKKHA